MVFDITGKIALITGGASGLGLRYAKELLSNGIGGVTIADVDVVKGKESEETLNKTYGANKVLFVKLDVTKWDEFEDAFKKTVERFKYVDILINNAGIMNDAVWEREIAININGTVNGIFLGLENYLQKNRQGDEAVIVNISSIVGIKGYGYMPVYCGTKFAVFGMTQAWSSPSHYQRTKVRVIAICPGATDTPLLDMDDKFWGPGYAETFGDTPELASLKKQGIDVLAEEMVKLIKRAPCGSVWVVEYDEPAYQFILPERDTMKGNVLKN